MAKAKGTTLLSLVKFLRSQGARARERLAPGLHRYLEESIQTASWYPEEDLLALIRAMVELVPGSREETLATMGAAVAREHLEGVYEHLRVDASDPATMAHRAFALWSTMHDSGVLRIAEEAADTAVFEVRDYALPSDEMCRILRAYFAETLRIAGCVEPEAREIACRRAGDEACRFRVHWRVAA